MSGRKGTRCIDPVTRQVMIKLTQRASEFSPFLIFSSTCFSFSPLIVVLFPYLVLNFVRQAFCLHPSCRLSLHPSPRLSSFSCLIFSSLPSLYLFAAFLCDCLPALDVCCGFNAFHLCSAPESENARFRIGSRVGPRGNSDERHYYNPNKGIQDWEKQMQEL
jgi:hypothetical protein